MRIELEEAKELIDWFMHRGLGLGECAWLLADLECGYSLSIALLKVFKERKIKLEKIHEKVTNDWGNPITP